MSKVLLEADKVCVYLPMVKGWLRRTSGYVRAVNHISFQIKKGETVALVGESGSGKSTLAKALIKLLPITSGRIVLAGQDITHLPERRFKEFRKKIQIVFQNPSQALNPRKTILETIIEPILVHCLVSNRQDAISECVKILDQVGLYQAVVTRYPHELSLGQQQRVAIARALALNPELIILDEAVSSLDISVQAQVLNLLQDIKQQRNISYLFISHDLGVVKHVADRILVMYLGQIVESGDILDVLQCPKHPYTQALLSSLSKQHPNQEIPKQIQLLGPPGDAANLPTGCFFHPRCPFRKPFCAKDSPPRQSIAPRDSSHRTEHIYSCILAP